LRFSGKGNPKGVGGKGLAPLTRRGRAVFCKEGGGIRRGEDKGAGEKPGDGERM